MLETYQPPSWVKTVTVGFCVQISAQSELRISGNLTNGERAESGSAETEGTEREIQPRRAPAPPPPWKPRTRGETLLPSRGKVKEEEEEEEEGGLPPPLSRWRRNAAGVIIARTIYTKNFTAVITNSFPLYAAV